MPRIGQASPRSVAATIDLGGEESISLVYRPQAIVTAATALRDVDDDDAIVQNVLANQLAGLLVSWDATGPLPDEDLTGFSTAKAGEIVAADQPIPVTADILSWLGIPVLKGIIMAVIQHSNDYPKGTQNGLHPPSPTPISITPTSP